MQSHIFLCSVYLILFFCKCCCSQDSGYNNCSTAAHCGSLGVIPYPFSVSHGCGHPGFLLQCHDNNTLLLKVNQGVYRILSFNAYYDLSSKFKRPTATIADENLFRSPCGFPNTTFNSSGSRFSLTREDYKEIANLLLDCPDIQQLQNVYSPCNNSCAFCREHHCYFAYSYDSTKLKKFTKQCNLIQVPLKNNTRANKKPLHELLLEGFQVEWNASDGHFVKCKGCLETGGLCGYHYRNRFVCYCRNGAHLDNCHTGNRIGGAKSSGLKSQMGVIIGGCIGCMVLIAIAASYMVIYRTKRDSSSSTHSLHADEMKRALSSLKLPVFIYKDLETATNFFDESRQIGDGAFHCVYQATLGDGQIAAVKKLYLDNSMSTEQFVNHIRILSSLSHPNLVRLMGFCQHGHVLLLVYDYAPNGTLADHLHGKRRTPQGLPWKTRLDITLQIARALEYLHFSLRPPVFHRDVKSSNILVDMDFRVKVADFGLCGLLSTEASCVSTIPHLTPGCLDPDCNEPCQLTDKSDVYSFGVLLFEIISGMKAGDSAKSRREVNLACLAKSKIQSGAVHELIDQRIGIESDPVINVMARRVCEVGFACLALKKDERPDMMKVVVQLEQVRRIGYGSSELFYTHKDKT
ncbi:hypothetical protein SUGI_0288210 [Cryptomeria japonica]|uniref:LEAF RUST 10 DISEASE-RESISTANCE LOCUS RECEPTOR-LIKE PROTEIN KINASE-like 1.5 n=1 Tax=Cryptomeria japonica TaxID=3369 RepID=UPI002408BE2C|nr:LEAF RUST 10 DISEASE-RESISTANCE LOCUS RECEPTOR-LIKE PROTEIN KINASE-like 1.5 [Cryptomeria japonica]GLJ16747.1 hypothetical protein SUGI_0288210 [Cryptomeria japonica]